MRVSKLINDAEKIFFTVTLSLFEGEMLKLVARKIFAKYVEGYGFIHFLKLFELILMKRIKPHTYR